MQLLSKLARAGIIENVRDEDVLEFREGELYRLSTKSPVRNLKTPGKNEKNAGDRKALVDIGNTPKRNLEKEDFRGDDKSDFSSVDGREREREKVDSKKKRESSKVRRAREDAVKKQLNLSYFQSLPSNSLIILDNDSTWRGDVYIL